MVLAAAAAAVILATSLPVSVLLKQHHQLSAASAQLSQMKQQNALLGQKRQQLRSNAEVMRLAQQNYQLVPAGRTLFSILPPAGDPTHRNPGGSVIGDPANQPLVSPSHAANMTPDPGLPSGVPSASARTSGAVLPASGSPAQPPSSFWSRVSSSLEFWK